jgi:N-acetylglutamate synthase-like GNAT family acetyltransferase
MDSVHIRLRPADDFAAMVKLGREAGLEIDHLGPVLSAYGLFDGDKLVGCACLKEREGAFLLECLAVAEPLRGTGLGTKLVRAVESDARGRGAKRLLVLARSPGFFQKVGYRIAEPGEVQYPTLSGCTGCPQFRNSCFPAVVLREI